MPERNYYVLRDDNCRFPAMTAEQVLEAIAEATGTTPVHVDDAFITKIKEQNGQGQVKLWVGTNAEYNAIETPESDTLYIITDASEYGDLESKIEQLETESESQAERIDNAYAGLDYDNDRIVQLATDIGDLAGEQASLKSRIQEAEKNIVHKPMISSGTLVSEDELDNISQSVLSFYSKSKRINIDSIGDNTAFDIVFNMQPNGNIPDNTKFFVEAELIIGKQETSSAGTDAVIEEHRNWYGEKVTLAGDAPMNFTIKEGYLNTHAFKNILYVFASVKVFYDNVPSSQDCWDTTLTIKKY